MNPLQQLHEHGQSFWFDQMRRSLATSGELKRMVEQDGLRGMTSNPTIFEKAIGAGEDYSTQLKELVESGSNASDAMLAMMVTDIQAAADVLRPVYDSSQGRDGFISLEVPPNLATETEETLRIARQLFARANRPNVMIKIPATPEGIPAVEQALYEGINVNITLMFSQKHYEAVAQAYVRALRRRLEEGKPVDRAASVASFFVSRVDTEVDKRLEALIAAAPESDRPRLEQLRGQAAIANARVTYARFQEIFHGPEFAALAAAGAPVQRPLWASTGTKNPAYSDVLYVEQLIGRDTVNTMPDATVTAFRDHGKVADTVGQGADEARQVVAELASVGIDLEEVGDKLQADGVQSFIKSFDDLLATIEQKRHQVLAGSVPRRLTLPPGPLGTAAEARLRQWGQQRAAERLWARDASIWTTDGQPIEGVGDWLGWLALPEELSTSAVNLHSFAEAVWQDGISEIVVLGMGGSSLFPEVLARTFFHESRVHLHVLDTTHPDCIAELEGVLELPRTLVVASSKSGTTLETRSQLEYFWDRFHSEGVPDAHRHFVAITDPGSELETLAQERSFRRVFPGRPDVGGRYSALSNFGAVPAALMGLDLGTLADRALAALRAAGDSESIPFQLGALAGEAAKAGRNKLTILPGAGIEAFGLWLEQLVAESTGKLGRGIVPVPGQPLDPSLYGPDRLFVYLPVGEFPDPQRDAAVTRIEAAGHPVVRIPLGDRYDLAAQVLTWEVAVAMAGSVLEINPFDQPNVQESKDNTKRVLAEWEAGGLQPVVPEEDPGRLLAELLDRIRPGDYFAVQAYLEPLDEVEHQVEELRRAVAARHHVATTFGWGPRFLHSTGQLHKGGPAQGVFLQLTDTPGQVADIPGSNFGFSTLIAAQSEGDRESLESHGRPVARIHLGHEPRVTMERLLDSLRAAAR